MNPRIAKLLTTALTYVNAKAELKIDIFGGTYGDRDGGFTITAVAAIHDGKIVANLTGKPTETP